MEFGALFGGIARRYRFVNTAGGMVLENRTFHLGQRRAHRLDLVQDINAIAVVRDHLAYTAYLTLHPFQAVDDVFLVLRHCANSLLLYPTGVSYSQGAKKEQVCLTS